MEYEEKKLFSLIWNETGQELSEDSPFWWLIQHTKNYKFKINCCFIMTVS
jgi:hypothetical protein